MRSPCGGHLHFNTLFLKQDLVDQGKRMMALTCAYAWGGMFQGVGIGVGLVFFGYQLDIHIEDFTFLDTNRVYQVMDGIYIFNIIWVYRPCKNLRT